MARHSLHGNNFGESYKKMRVYILLKRFSSFSVFQVKPFTWLETLGTFVKRNFPPDKCQSTCADNTLTTQNSTGEKNGLWRQSKLNNIFGISRFLYSFGALPIEIDKRMGMIP